MKLNEKSNIKKILILRLSSLGDVLLTTPLVRILSKHFPDSRIDYVISEPYYDLIKNNPYLFNILIYDKSKSVFNPLTNPEQLLESYDLVIDLQANLRTKILSFNKALIRKQYSKQRLHKLSLVFRKKPLIEDFSVPLNYINSINIDHIEDDGLGLEFWLKKDLTAKEYLPVSNKKKPRNESVITIAPGAKHFTKRWKSEGYISLIKQLNEKYKCQINLVGSESEKEVCSFIESKIKFPINNLCGKLSLEETAELIDSSGLVISNDSGIMHIAAARNIPVIVIFGSTVPEFGFYPFRTHFEIVQKELSCRPCTHIGREKCPKKHFDCMNLISPEDILIKVDKILTNKV